MVRCFGRCLYFEKVVSNGGGMLLCIRKEIPSRLLNSHMSVERNTFVNTKSGIDRKAYNKQRNLCLSLIISEKKNFLVMLIQVTFQVKKLLEDSKFSLTKKSCLSGRSSGNSFKKNNLIRSRCNRSF